MFCDIWFKPELQAYLQIFRGAAMVKKSGQYSFVIERARDRLASSDPASINIHPIFKFVFALISILEDLCEHGESQK